ncbi:MAG: hypothetical protein PHF37_07330 [Phycisphaerae bacterium]|nr:hypothetical protein [Phycisphaerae bacterium]
MANIKRSLTEKDEKLAELVDMMKKNIRYADNTTDFNNDKLKLLGWSARKRRGKLQPPGQCMGLKVRYQAGGVIILEWKKPADGGRVRFYEMLRRVDGGIGSSPVVRRRKRRL